MQSAFSAGEEFTQPDLMSAIAGCIPLAQIAEAQIEDLKTWTIRSGAKSASIPDLYAIPGSFSSLSPLQVDEN